MMGRLREGAERLGPLGMAGVVFLTLALVLALTAGRKLWAQRAALQAEQAGGAAVPRTVAAPPDDAAAQLARFVTTFPAAGASADGLAKIQRVARRTGLQLASGEYRLEQRAGEPLQRYAVVLPVQGSYGQLRRFIDGVLADLPYAALEDVELKRETADSPQLEARVRLTLYLRGTP